MVLLLTFIVTSITFLSTVFLTKAVQHLESVNVGVTALSSGVNEKIIPLTKADIQAEKEKSELAEVFITNLRDNYKKMNISRKISLLHFLKLRFPLQVGAK